MAKSTKNKTNTLWTNDNLYVLNGMNSESVDLIYLDPPFNSKRLYKAPIGSKAAGAEFKDIWTWSDVDEACLEKMVLDHLPLKHFISSVGGTHGKAMMAYLTFMTQRIIELHRVLKSTGSIYLHCDPTASHYLKIIMDTIFDKNNFRNEIIWHYGKWSNSAKYFQRNHDIILFYSKSAKYHFDRIHVARRNQSPYNIQGGKVNQLLIYDEDNTPNEIIQREKKKGRSVIYVDTQGPSEHDVWTYLRSKKLDYIPPRSKERTGFRTQKPLTLLHRIIRASSKEGDVVLDPFCGCATTCVAAQQLRRRWIGIDIEKTSGRLMSERLEDEAGLFEDFTHRFDLPERTDVKIELPDIPMKQQLHKEQKGKCNGCDTAFEIQHFDIDHIIPTSKGGGNYKANYQLLCGNCNRIKGDRPMEYLLAKIAKREEMAKKISFGNKLFDN